MTLQINGQSKDVDSVSNIAELVAALGLPAEVLLVEHNGLALRRTEWTETTLKGGDKVELMQIAAGG